MSKPYLWTLEEDYHVSLGFTIAIEKMDFHDNKGNKWMTIDYDTLTIYKDYSWDGCSPKFKIGGKIFGIWDGTKIAHIINGDEIDVDSQMKYASLIHDVMYQFLDDIPLSRKDVDSIFLKDALNANFIFSWLYYCFVRVFGKFYLKYM